MSRRIKTFTDRYPFIGPGMWMLSVQYFITQVIVARAWPTTYSISKNAISDLGNTKCGIYSTRYVCSPLHSLMNSSFIILGLFMFFGSMLIYQEFKRTDKSLIGFSSLMIAGAGTVLVGLFPENSVAALHVLGAFLPFFVGNVGITILGVILQIPRGLRIYTLITGILSLIALIFFISHAYLGLGIGGMERIVAYPQTIWLIVFGLYISKNHFMKLKSKATKKP